MPPPAIAAVAALVGLTFGSFLNVCITRLPRGESIVHPRSRCPQCKASIGALDNIPMLSWLLLAGRCRHCRQRISVQYPLVELATSAWFAACVLLFPDWLAALNMAALGFLLIGLLVMDWQTQLLPDAFTIGGVGMGLMFCFIRATLLPIDRGTFFLTSPERMMLLRLLSVMMSFLLLFAVRWTYRVVRHREGLGLGDAKMLAMIAAFLGLHLALLALFLGVLAGALYAVSLVVLRRATSATRLPFGSFLAIGGFIATLAGPSLLHWYLALFR
jgi:leader peptidase (prepilin peptidase)/N-methyltransferase